jgi:HK97 family phage major capsid protein
MPPTIWDANAIKNIYIPTNLGAGVTQSYQIAGDFRYAHIGDNQNVVIDVSKEAGFASNQTWFRAVRRVAFRLSDATKFCRITGVTVA